MSRPAPRAKEHHELALRQLAALYRRVDALLSGSSCPGSTDCCRFGITGREPYVTSIEIAAIERALARRGGPLSPKRRALPMARSAEHERICALLDDSGRCCVYESRPFGCRTFYCHRATVAAPLGPSERRELVNLLREIASLHEAGGDAPRPLSRVFSTRASRGRP